MTDPDILREMISRTELAYRLSHGSIIGRGRSALEVAARVELITEASRAGYSQAFLAQFLDRDPSTISHAIKSRKEAA